MEAWDFRKSLLICFLKLKIYLQNILKESVFFFSFQFGLQRILGDERSLLLLARAIDPKQPNMMTEIVKILSAICIVGEENM